MEIDTSERSPYRQPICAPTGSILARAGCALLLTGGVIYGSLIPFRIDPARLSTTHFTATFLRAHDLHADDVTVNIVLYGILSAGLFCLTRNRRPVVALVVLLVCSMLSLAVEAAQTLLPHRVSSASDVFCNVIGSGLGVALCFLFRDVHQPIVHRVVLELRRQPWNAMGILISSGLLAYGLIPFDFVTSTEQLHASFQRLQLPQPPGGIAAITGELCGAGWFALLGLVIAKDGFDSGQSRARAVLAGLAHGLLVASLIEALQLFTKSHVPEAGTAILRSLACLGGGWFAVFLSPARTRDPIRPTLSNSVFLFALAIQTGNILLGDVSRHGVNSPVHQLGLSLPFRTLWLQPSARAGAHAASIFVTSSLLTLTLIVLLRRSGLAKFRPMAAGLVLAVYFGATFGASWLQTKPIDLTDAILALLACSATLSIDRRIAYSKLIALKGR